LRDLFNDIFDEIRLSDPDPVRRSQIAMRKPKRKRFYKTVTVRPGEDVFEVFLDDRVLTTPGRKPLPFVRATLALRLADEFDAQTSEIDAVNMPFYRLVNTAFDAVADTMEAVRADIHGFAGTDMLLYRADGPERLVERQAAIWDPILEWANQSLDARFVLAQGIMPVTQPAQSLQRIATHLAVFTDPLELSALHVATTLTGSALIALALQAGYLTPDQAWTAGHVDEDWNIELWGEDDMATAARAFKRRTFDAAALVLVAD
jgi:chaperone required for assembly of F1-ATPase